MPHANENIIKWFEMLIKQLQFYIDIKKGKERLIYTYKLDSIQKALDVIKKIDFKIKKGSDVKDYVHIGKGTVARIDEILETGKLSEVNDADISGKYLAYIEELEKIFGVGRTKAHELYTEYGITSIDDLKKAVKEGTVDLPENIMKGLKYVDDIKLNIPRAEVDKIYSYLLRTSLNIDPELDVRVCGSYRREKVTSNDIDVIIAHPNIKTKMQAAQSNILKTFIKHLEKDGFIVDSLTSIDVPTKYMGVCRYSDNLLTNQKSKINSKINSKKDDAYPVRRIDVRFIPQESYYTAILYFTGGKDLNRNMRMVAKDMGYTLNEYALLDDKGNSIYVDSEKDIFKKLGMEYLVPSNR